MGAKNNKDKVVKEEDTKTQHDVKEKDGVAKTNKKYEN